MVHEVHPKTRWEFIDHDYIDKLSDKEKQFLSDFNEEYLGGNFQHKGKKLHRTKKERRECYGRNNSRNRDIFAILRTRGWIIGDEKGERNGSPWHSKMEESSNTNPAAVEDVLLELIDLKKKL